MKSSELKQLIKEEIVSILSENQDMRGIIDEFSKEFNIPAYALRYFDYGSDGSGELRIEMKSNIFDDFGKMVKFLQDKGFEVDENKSEVDYEIDDDRIRYPYIKIKKKSKDQLNEIFDRKITKIIKKYDPNFFDDWVTGTFKKQVKDEIDTSGFKKTVKGILQKLYNTEYPNKSIPTAQTNETVDDIMKFMYKIYFNRGDRKNDMGGLNKFNVHNYLKYFGTSYADLKNKAQKEIE